MSPTKKSMTLARQTIFAQLAPLSVKRSAWVLYQHELTRIDPRTRKPFTPRRALSNTLKWLAWQATRQDAAMKTITPTQRRILHLLVVEGLTQKQMALALGVETVTIKRHFTEIRKRIGVSSTYQVVAIAVEMGLVSAPQKKD